MKPSLILLGITNFLMGLATTFVAFFGLLNLLEPPLFAFMLLLAICGIIGVVWLVCGFLLILGGFGVIK